MEGCFFLSFVSEFVGLLLAIKGPAKSWGFWCFVGMLSCSALPGAVPVVGGILPRYHGFSGVAPREGRAVHRPRHLALHIPLRLVKGFDRLPYCVLLVFCLSFVLVISSWGLICCMVTSPFKARPLSGRVFAPLFFSVRLVRRRRFFSLTLSFCSSGAGETQTL